MKNKITESEPIPSNSIAKNSVLSRWLPLSILISLLFHIALFWWTRGITWKHPVAIPPTQPTRPFHLIKAEKVYPSPPPVHPTPSPALKQQTASAPEQPALPVEKMEPRPDIGTLPTEDLASLPKFNQALLEERPGDISHSINANIQKALSHGIQKDPLTQDQPHSITNNLFELAQSNEPEDTAQAASGQQPGSIPHGFSDLDTLLTQTGPLQPETAPILMPTDVLFDYDTAQLRPEALDSLRKLGTLIKKNPNATFVIEGHTDSFGRVTYNLELSLKRANAVKDWLVQNMGIQDPKRIEAKGYGKSRLLVPASGTIQQQKVNRRVEIIIHVPPGPHASRSH